MFFRNITLSVSYLVIKSSNLHTTGSRKYNSGILIYCTVQILHYVWYEFIVVKKVLRRTRAGQTGLSGPFTRRGL